MIRKFENKKFVIVQMGFSLDFSPFLYIRYITKLKYLLCLIWEVKIKSDRGRVSRQPMCVVASHINYTHQWAAL